MAHYLGLHRYQEKDWERVSLALQQTTLFEEPPARPEPVKESPEPEAVADQAQPVATAQPVPNPPPAPRPAAPMARRTSQSGYLKRR